MKIKLVNLGVLRQAEFVLGDLTIICGKNNTGKTYATYALYGFLDFWHDNFTIDISAEDVNRLFKNGIVELAINDFISDKDKILADASKAYSKLLYRVFASSESLFTKSHVEVSLSQEEIIPEGNYSRIIGPPNQNFFKIMKEQNPSRVVVTLLVEKEKIELPVDVVRYTIGKAVKEIVFGLSFPKPFIASAERTGAAMFRKELDLARNRLLDQMKTSSRKLNFFDLFNKVYTSYALPVMKNVDFTRELEDLAKKESFLWLKHKDLLKEFSDIIGGEFNIKREGIFFVPNQNRNIRLTMNESSSGVRSLLDLGFYLKHMAQQNDLLMIDEPELDLHPENQRRLARLFARLVNLGLKVFITTHSDYIIKELNTLIMLNSQSLGVVSVKEKYKYKDNELLKAKQLKVYIAKTELTRLNGNYRSSRVPTLKKSEVDSEFGIWAESFDNTINEMNRIQKAILFGKER